MALCALSEQGSEGIRAPTDADQGQLLYSICSCLLALSRPIDFNSDKKLQVRWLAVGQLFPSSLHQGVG